MKKIRNWLFGVVGLVIFFGMLSNSEHSSRITGSASETDSNSDENSTKQSLVESIRKKFGKSWKVEVETYDDSGAIVYINYSREPESFEKVERDTRKVVRFILDKVIEEGRHPTKPAFSVFVTGAQKVKGETGEDLTKVFGTSHYNPLDDQITWEAGK